MKFKNITVVGAGYVGLSIGALLSKDYSVNLVDTDKSKIKKIQQKISPLEEPDLINFFKNSSGFTSSSETLSDYFEKTDLYILCLPTNYDSEKNCLDISIIEKVCHEITANDSEAAILIKSTMPVGATKKLISSTSNEEIYFSPEFLREGQALNDNMNPSRIIIGGKGKSSQPIAELFRLLAQNNPNVMYVSSCEAEAIKIFSNTYLAMRIAYFNELDTYCELNHLSTKNVIDGISEDSRIGSYYNNPSFGYGGYCLPKDTKQAESLFKNIKSELIPAISASNESRKQHIISQIKELKENKVGFYRINMKANSDNIRESATFDLILSLKDSGKEILIYEPLIKEKYFQGILVENDESKFFHSCDLIISNRHLVTGYEHKKIYTRDLYNEN